MKRYVTIKLEYDFEEETKIRNYLTTVIANIHKLLEEDMPYLKIMKISDSSNKE